MLHRSIAIAASTLVGFAALAAPVAAETTTRPAYGCLKASSSTAIRDKASDKGAVIAQASKGDILIKMKRFCSLGSKWCSVSASGVTGWVAKSATKVAPCPASTSKPKT